VFHIILKSNGISWKVIKRLYDIVGYCCGNAFGPPIIDLYVR